MREARNPNVDNSVGGGCLLPGVVPEIRNKLQCPNPEIENGAIAGGFSEAYLVAFRIDYRGIPLAWFAYFAVDDPLSVPAPDRRPG